MKVGNNKSQEAWPYVQERTEHLSPIYLQWPTKMATSFGKKAQLYEFKYTTNISVHSYICHGDWDISYWQWKQNVYIINYSWRLWMINVKNKWSCREIYSSRILNLLWKAYSAWRNWWNWYFAEALGFLLSSTVSKYRSVIFFPRVWKIWISPEMTSYLFHPPLHPRYLSVLIFYLSEVLNQGIIFVKCLVKQL